LRRLQTATLVVVVLAGTAGGFVFLSDAFHDGSASIGGSVTPLPSATTTAPSGPIDIGLGFPVCDVRTMHTDLDGSGTVDTVSVATKMSDAPDCPAPGTSSELLVVDLNGDGKADATGGPLACPTGCEPFATPDVNGDGLPEIAIVVDRPADGTKRIQLWDLTTPPGGSLAVIPFVDANGDPATFTWGTVSNWGGHGPEDFGVSCTSRTSPPLVTEWQAIPTGPGSWHISEHGYHVVGSELRSSFEDSYDVPGEETAFPDGGGDTMCGALVLSTTAAPTRSDLGLGFPVCDVQNMSSDFNGDGAADTAYLAAKMNDIGCPTNGTDVEFLVVDLNADGQADTVFGPLQCESRCRMFGTPDLDGDGRADIAIIQQDHPVDFVTTYRLIGGALESFVVADGAGTHPLAIAWGHDASTSPPTVSGAFCNPSEAGPELVVWEADELGGGAFRERQRSYHFDGSRLIQPSTTPIDVPADESSLPSLDTLCGAPVTP
jgi:hypothetical protein